MEKDSLEAAVLVEEEVAKAVVEEPQAAEKPKAVALSPKQKEEKPVRSSGGNSASELLMNLFRLVLGLFIWLPAFMALLASLVVFGVVISLVLVAGYSYVWLLLIVFGGILICLAFVVPLSRLIWRKI